ncbi:MAG: hypothetical protein M0T74_10280 [Desulfitobacterium hafniense]|nr:hypothetical protein [Desulfitobacterium hafniense]
MRHNVLNRKKYDDVYQEIIGDEVLTENHAIMMYEPLLGSNENIIDSGLP